MVTAREIGLAVLAAVIVYEFRQPRRAGVAPA